MNINEYISNNRIGYKNTMVRQVQCADGFKMSVQASSFHYCYPRTNEATHYDTVEIGYPSAKEELIMDYAEEPTTPCGTVYAQVPVEVVNAVIAKHGGFASDEG